MRGVAGFSAKRGFALECAPTRDTILFVKQTASPATSKSLAEAKLGLAPSNDVVFGSKREL